MTEETLRELLARVHERLSSSNSVDPEAREMLSTVMRDIDGALSRGAAAAPGAALPLVLADDPKAPTVTLESLAVRFETEHPAIAQLLRQIAALLGQAGI